MMFCVLSLGLVLAACGKDGMPGTGDDSSGDDGPGDDGGTIPDSSIDPPARGFQIQSPDIEIQAGQEITYCYYFRTPNTEPLVIKKWSSVMTEGSHHMIFYTTNNDDMPPGTVSAAECGGFSIQNVPHWTYATQTHLLQEVELPQDDGTGKPLGQQIAAGTAGYFQMHYLNASDSPIMANVTLNAEAYEVGVDYTKTAPFITYNSNINIPAGAMGTKATATIPLATAGGGKKFWQMSTHAHKQAVQTEVRDGANVVFTSDDWEHPGTKNWMAAPFYEFTSGLTYECTYNNTGSNAGQTVVDGSSAATNEMCMATGFYFPASSPVTCLNNQCANF